MLQHSQTRLTPLMTAVMRDNSEISEQLLKLGASVSLRCSKGMTAVDWAIIKQNLQVLKLFYSCM